MRSPATPEPTSPLPETPHGLARGAPATPLMKTGTPGTPRTAGTPRSFFKSSEHRADGLVWSAESGSAWTLLYPDYSVVPLRPLFQVPLGYPVAPRDGNLERSTDKLREK